MNAWSAYWLYWFLALLVSFLGPELYALVTGHGENTLSAQVWKLEGLAPGQHVWQWTALHVLIGGGLGLLFVWLIFHFVFGIWR